MAGSRSDNEEYLVPFRGQRVFGSGLKRKRVQFVASSHHDNDDGGQVKPKQVAPASPANQYLSIVFPNASARTQEAITNTASAESVPLKESSTKLCPICKLPVHQAHAANEVQPPTGSAPMQSAHETSIAHQLCLAHVHPPSHLNRSRLGFRYLASYGWDPDSREGLGSSGRGILAPIKAKDKHDTIGVGAEAEQEQRRQRVSKLGDSKCRRKDTKVATNQTRQKVKESRRREQSLRQMIWGDDRLEEYLGLPAHID